MTKFSLSLESIKKIIKEFPKIKQPIIDRISDQMDVELWRRERRPGRKYEHMGTTGLCAVISHEILPLLKEAYHDIKVKTGYFKLDHHPRYKDQKIYSLHSWLELDGKILDFTANQFNPFVNNKIEEIHICPMNSPEVERYMKYNPTYLDVGLDEEEILN